MDKHQTAKDIAQLDDAIMIATAIHTELCTNYENNPSEELAAKGDAQSDYIDKMKAKKAQSESELGSAGIDSNTRALVSANID
ncbi:hypothetical protein [Arthrobacter castelli]|uniref:hypothetical protein n=1 Tax=Arthrobacter castelli TaxID=271431 RepID=UPI00040BF89D|nr:hypothetical protein [Arthrobacter castelli]